MSNNASLTDYADSSAPTQPEPDDTTHLEHITIDDITLPDGHDWDDEVKMHHTDAAAYVGFVGDEEFEVVNSGLPETIESGQVGYIVDGLESLKDASDRVERITPPSTYGDFEDFDDIRVEPTTTFTSGRHGAWGISPSLYEAAVRFVTGGGRYRTADLTTLTLDRDIGWVIHYHGDAYLFAYQPVSGPVDGEVLTEREVSGITVVNEADETVLDGIREMMDRMPEFGIEITGFQQRNENSLYFETDQEKPIRFTGSQLKKFLNPETDLAELEGTYERELYYQDDVYEYTWPEGATDQEPGDTRDWGENRTRCTLGYTKHIDPVMRGPPLGRKVEVGFRVYAKEHTMTLKETDDSIDVRMPTNATQEKITAVGYDTPDIENPDEFDEKHMWDPSDDNF